MIIGVPKEIKNEEYRVAITPMAAAVLAQAGHRVLIQTTSGEGSGFSDKEYAFRYNHRGVETPMFKIFLSRIS